MKNWYKNMGENKKKLKQPLDFFEIFCFYLIILYYNYYYIELGRPKNLGLAHLG
jgi:hypothetical protein